MLEMVAASGGRDCIRPAEVHSSQHGLQAPTVFGNHATLSREIGITTLDNVHMNW